MVVQCFQGLGHQFVNRVQALKNPCWCLSPLDQIAHQHQGLVHLPEVTDAFPTHGLVNMEQCPFPTIESRVVGYLLTKALPCTLKIGQDGLFVASVRYQIP